jgi:hypothetical protein
MKKQTLEEFINSQPYYGHGTPEYLEGIEVGAKWQQEQAKEMEKEQIAQAFEDGAHNYFYSIETGEGFESGIEYYNEKFKQQEQ